MQYDFQIFFLSKVYSRECRLHIPGGVLCDTSSLSHGDSADQRSRDSRGPMNSQPELLNPFTLYIPSHTYYQIPAPFSLLLLLSERCSRHHPSLLLGSPSPSSQKTAAISRMYTHFLMRKEKRQILFCLQQTQMTISLLLLQKHTSQLNLVNFQSLQSNNLIFALMSAPESFVSL